jgi:hypothetical protein
VKSIVTGADGHAESGDLGPEAQHDPLVGLDADGQQVRVRLGVGVAEQRCGTSRNWIAISVARFGSRLPVRT